MRTATATATHPNLAPPSPGRWLGPVGLALIAHGLLVAALTWGVGWKTDAPPAVFEAELWSSLPQLAAPRAVEPPPSPPASEFPPPRPQPRPATAPAPVPAPAPTQATQAERQADIATAQAKKKTELERKAREEAAARKAAQDKIDAAKLAADQTAATEKNTAAEKAAREKERQQKLAEQKRQKERQQATEQRDAAMAEQQREEQLRRIMGQAGASGATQATGTAQQSSGPSSGYKGRLAAHVKPNVVFTDVIIGNPRAEVEVRALPDGTITFAKLNKSSGNKAWDSAAVRAIERTAKLPRDTDGKIPSWFIFEFGPQD